MFSDTCSNTGRRIAFSSRISAWTLTLTQSVSSWLAVDYAVWSAVLAAILGAAELGSTEFGVELKLLRAAVLDYDFGQIRGHCDNRFFCTRIWSRAQGESYSKHRCLIPGLDPCTECLASVSYGFCSGLLSLYADYALT